MEHIELLFQQVKIVVFGPLHHQIHLELTLKFLVVFLLLVLEEAAVLVLLVVLVLVVYFIRTDMVYLLGNILLQLVKVVLEERAEMLVDRENRLFLMV